MTDTGTGVITQLVATVIILAVSVLLHEAWRRRDAVFFAPKSAASGSRGFFAWLGPVMRTSDEQIFARHGFDAVVFLVFLRAAFLVSLVLSIGGLTVLLPVNLAASPRPRDMNTTIIDTLGLGNVRDETPALLVHVGWVYFQVLVVLVAMFLVNRSVAAYRTKHQARRSDTLAARTIMIRNLPPEYTDEAVLAKFLARVPLRAGDSVEAIHVVRDADDLLHKVGQREKHVRLLEAAQCEWHRTGQVPQGTVERSIVDPLGRHVDNKVGYFEDSTLRTRREIEFERRDMMYADSTQMPAAFITFSDPALANTLSQVAWFKGSSVHMAPVPDDILWDNLAMSKTSLIARKWAVLAIMVALTLLWTIPTGFLSAFTQPDYLAAKLPWLAPVLSAPAISGVLTSVLPSIVVKIFLSILPAILAALSRFQGIPAASWVDVSVTGKFFVFQIFNVLLVFTIGPAIFSVLGQIASNPSTILTKLGTTLPSEVVFFLTYVLVNTALLGFELARIVPYVVYKVKSRFVAKTRRARHELVQSTRTLAYSEKYPTLLLQLVIVLVYTPMNPLIAVVGVVFFGLAFLVYKHQMIALFEPAHETGGRYWRTVHAQLATGLMLAVVIAACVIGVKRNIIAACLLVPLLLVVFVVAGVYRDIFFAAAKAGDTAVPLESMALKRGESMSSDAVVVGAPSNDDDEEDDDEHISNECKLRTYQHPGIARPLMTPWL